MSELNRLSVPSGNQEIPHEVLHFMFQVQESGSVASATWFADKTGAGTLRAPQFDVTEVRQVPTTDERLTN